MLKRLINSNHFYSFIGVIGGAGTAFLSFALLARELSKSEFGHWALFLAILTFIDMIKAGAVQSPLIKYASGEKEEEQTKNYATSWKINIVFTIVLLLSFIVLILFLGASSIVVEFLGYYLIYSIVSMPFHYGTWIANLNLKFKTSMVLRLGTSFSFFIGLVVLKFFNTINFQSIVLLYCFSFFLISFAAIFTCKTGINSLLKKQETHLVKYLNFARYHMFAFLGSNLLKSFDTFIISFLLGPASVALYNVPLRLVEVIEMPLKSALNVGFPKFSSLHNKGLFDDLNVLVGRYIGVLTFLYLPFMLLLYFFAEELILITGGKGYIGATPIFKIFIFYGLIIPFDRITGVVLDAVGKPKLNSRKVFFMAITNIIGDIIVITIFKSLEAVAFVTVLNVIVGAFIGFYLVSKNVEFKLSHISLRGLLSFESNHKSKNT